MGLSFDFFVLHAIRKSRCLSGVAGGLETPAFIYKMLSNTDFASTVFVSHLYQFSAFGICVLRIGLYLRICFIFQTDADAGHHIQNVVEGYSSTL